MAETVHIEEPRQAHPPRLPPADRVLSWASMRAHQAIRRAVSSRDGVVFVDVLGRSTIPRDLVSAGVIEPR